MDKRDLELVLQKVCCSSGEKRYCNICPWKGKNECENEIIESEEYFKSTESVYKYYCIM